MQELESVEEQDINSIDEEASLGQCTDLLNGTSSQYDICALDSSAVSDALTEKILNERCVFEGKIFNVNRLDVELPDGRHGVRDIVRHPGAVGVIALTNKGKIVLVRQYRASLDRITLEIPAGKLELGEDPLEAAQRELTEETGFVAKNIAFLTTIASSVGFTDELISLYLATDLHFEGANPDDDEFINVDLLEVSQLIDAVLDGKIEDAKTITGALLCDAIARRLDNDVPVE